MWRDGHVTGDAVDLAELHALMADEAAVAWVDLVGTQRAQLDLLAETLGLDPHAIEDAVAHIERPKATRHAGHTFVTTYATSLDDDPDARNHASRLTFHKISAFVLPRLLITVRRDDRFPMDDVLDRWTDNADLLTGPHAIGALLHGLLDVVVDAHFATIEQLDQATEDIEDLLFQGQAAPGEVQQRVYRMRKELVQLRRVVLPMREVVNTVLRHRQDIGAEDGDPLAGYYDDLYDHVLRAAEWTESLRDMVTTVFETNLSLQDAHLNIVMKKLAGWAAIIAVPTAVTGWFGQNVPYPGFGTAFGLWQSTILLIVASLTLYLVFRRKDWL